MRTHKKIPVILLMLALGMTLAACKEIDGAGLKFSHALHKGEAECSDCHGNRKDTMRTGMEPCKECHEIDEANPSESCLACHTVTKDDSYAVASSAKSGSYADVIFDHAAHDTVECAKCHEAVADTEKLGAESALPGMALCSSCHNDDEAPAGCDTCHTDTQAEVAPASHTPLWATTHGDGPDQSCGYCHEGRDTCTECHRTTTPESHTAGWKFKSHGFQATHDRNACDTCHTTSYCADCHQQAPRSHKPRNGWLASGHGLDGALNRDGCAVCHSNTQPSCRVCHTNGF